MMNALYELLNSVHAILINSITLVVINRYCFAEK